jgi:hypothetical protein
MFEAATNTSQKWHFSLFYSSHTKWGVLQRTRSKRRVIPRLRGDAFLSMCWNRTQLALAAVHSARCTSGLDDFDDWMTWRGFLERGLDQ